MNQTHKISKTVKIVVLSLFEMHIIAVGVIGYFTSDGASRSPDEVASPFALMIAGIIFTLYALILLWFLERVLKYFATRVKREVPLFTSEGWRLVLSYMLLYSPTVFGLTLLEMGLSFSQFTFFPVTIIVAALIWGINDLRKSSQTDLVQ